MKRFLALTLALLLLGSFSGCTKRQETAPAPTEPPVTSTPASAETATPAPTPAPTSAPTPEPEKPALAVLRRWDEELITEYVLIAVSPEVTFVGEAAVNSEGVSALVHYLLSGDGSARVTGYGGGAFTMAEGLPAYAGEIPEAGENKLIRLGVSQSLLDSGLPEAVLPAFSGRYGYEAEVFSASEEELVRTAKAGKLDLLLIEAGTEADTFARSGLAGRLEDFDSVSVPFLRTGYVLLGPEDDPAGAAQAATLTEALETILRGGFTLCTHGEGTTPGAAETAVVSSLSGEGDSALSLRPIDGTDAEVLPEARETGAYLLTDPVTFAKYDTQK